MKRSRLRTVEDFMTTAVISLKEDAKIKDAAHEMRGADIRHIPVVDGRFKVLGILSTHDFMRQEAGQDDPIERIMTRRVHSVRSSTPAYDKISALPVVDENDVLIGIVTATDLLVVAKQALEGADMSRTAAEL